MNQDFIALLARGTVIFQAEQQSDIRYVGASLCNCKNCIVMLCTIHNMIIFITIHKNNTVNYIMLPMKIIMLCKITLIPSLNIIKKGPIEARYGYVG